MILLPDDKPLFGSLLAPNQYAKGLVGFWPFREAGNLVDYSGNENDGAITSATWRGQGLNFNGSSDEVVVPGAPFNNILDTITVCAWVVSDDGTRGDIVTHWGVDNDRHFDLLQGVTASKFTFFIAKADTSLVNSGASTTAIVAGTRYFITGVYDGTDVIIYVNGIRENSSATTGQMDTSAVNMIIGSNDASDFYAGDIEYTSIYNRALNDSEIKALSIDPWLPIYQSQAVRMAILSGGIAPVTGAVRLINGGLVNSGLIGGRLIA